MHHVVCLDHYQKHECVHLHIGFKLIRTTSVALIISSYDWLYLAVPVWFQLIQSGTCREICIYAWQKCSLVRWANIDCNCNIFTGKWTRGVDYLEWTRPLDVNVVLVDTIEKALFEKAVFEMFKMTRSCHVSLIEIIVHNGGSFFIIKGSLLSITSCTITHVKTCIKKCQQTLVSLYNSLHYSLHTCHYHLFMYWIAPIESSPPPQKNNK